MNLRNRYFPFLAVLLSVAACSDDDDSNGGTADSGVVADAARDAISTDSAPGTDSAPATVTGDAQIAAVLATANTGEIAQGQLAQSKATSAAVKSFAAMMVTDHTKANGDLTALEQKLSLTPEDNATAAALKSDNDRSTAAITPLTGAAFDAAYVDAQVKAHTKVLGLIDAQLTPAAQAADMKTLLTSARATVAMHLQMAKDLQADGGAGDAGAGDAGDAGDGAARDATAE